MTRCPTSEPHVNKADAVTVKRLLVIIIVNVESWRLR